MKPPRPGAVSTMTHEPGSPPLYAFWRLNLTQPEPALLAFLDGKPRSQHNDWLVVTHYLRKHGTVTQTRLHELVAFLRLSAAELRAYVAQLSAVGFVEILFPGYRRRATTYRWLLTPAPPVAPAPPPDAA